MDATLPGRRQIRQHARFLSVPARNAKAAKRFLGKALNGLKDREKPTTINTDKAPTYAIAQLKAESKFPVEVVHRQIKYLNNVVEAEATDQTGERVQDAENGLCDDQRFRGHARFAQRTSCDFQPDGRHPWRSTHC